MIRLEKVEKLMPIITLNIEKIINKFYLQNEKVKFMQNLIINMILQEQGFYSITILYT